MSKRISANDAYINRCLDYGSEEDAEKESESKLWANLATWAFSQNPEIPVSDEMTSTTAESLLDKVGRDVKGLRTVGAWQSAARYFEAENFHGLTGPACMRAKRLEKKPKSRRRAS